MLELDHVAIRARTLAEGVAYVRDRLGVEMPFGGAHPVMGTHNHLMRLGRDEFLEVISVDPLVAPERPRWFGLDEFHGDPAIGVWVLRGQGGSRVSVDLGMDMGPFVEITRGALRWQLTVRDRGDLAMDGACPAIIRWENGDKPGARMADLGCALVDFRVAHPQAQVLEQALAPVFRDPRVRFEQGPLSLTATIRTPDGDRVL